MYDKIRRLHVIILCPSKLANEDAPYKVPQMPSCASINLNEKLLRIFLAFHFRLRVLSGIFEKSWGHFDTFRHKV